VYTESPKDKLRPNRLGKIETRIIERKGGKADRGERSKFFRLRKGQLDII